MEPCTPPRSSITTSGMRASVFSCSICLTYVERSVFKSSSVVASLPGGQMRIARMVNT